MQGKTSNNMINIILLKDWLPEGGRIKRAGAKMFVPEKTAAELVKGGYIKAYPGYKIKEVVLTNKSKKDGK